MVEASRGTATSWRERHFAALAHPEEEELPLVLLMEATVHLSARYSQDVELRRGVVGVLLALRVLLNGSRGRLDGTSVESFIQHYMNICNFDPDIEQFRDG